MQSQYSYLISLMTWSFSRLRAYEDCGYSFFLRYIEEEEEVQHFYAEYGSLIHRILEQFYSGAITKEQALSKFMIGFVLDLPDEVKPSIVEKYYQQGKEYLSSLAMSKEKIVGIEEKFNFKVGDYPFVGFVDLLLEDENGLIIQDHKSHILRRGTKKQEEEFDSFAKQLYLYSAGIEQKYGRLPYKLRFNCFRDGTMPEEMFNESKYEETKQWALDTISRIEQESKWEPALEWFKCRYICGFSDSCEYNEMIQGG